MQAISGLSVRRVGSPSIYSWPLRLYLLDLPKSELAADLLNRDDLQGTALYRLLVHEAVRTPGAHPWAVVGGVYTFDRTNEDVDMLERIARVCTEAGAPFLAAASPDIVGRPSFGTTPDPDDWKTVATQGQNEESWERLRHLPEASCIGLALPRFLLRLPYGQETEPISAFTFEEMVGVPSQEDYCCGNPMYACLVLLGLAFSEGGWEMRPGSIKDIDGLPLHVYQDDSGESATRPCSEVLFTETTVESLLHEGLMPFVSYKDQDSDSSHTISIVRITADCAHGPVEYRLMPNVLKNGGFGEKHIEELGARSQTVWYLANQESVGAVP